MAAHISTSPKSKKKQMTALGANQGKERSLAARINSFKNIHIFWPNKLHFYL